MKTKEDILKEKAGIYQFTNGWTFEDDQKLIKAIHEAMEEYAALRQPLVIKSVCDKCEELQAEVNRCYEAMDAKKGIIG